ncbi:MAG: LPS assembly lipoprotein LptE [Caldimonas sp.]
MRRRFLLLGAAATLAGCGFTLKRPPELAFKTIQLNGFAARSPLAAELRTSLEASPTTRVVESVGEAQVVLQALSEAREKVVVAQTSASQIREFELRLRFTFRVRSATGKDLLPDSEIVQRRSLTYTESAALAKEQEEAFLYRSMQSDIVSQVLRRLASVRLL